MKQFAIFFAVTGLFLSSCEKYPEGPAISLLSKTSRLENSWVLSKAIENGTDKTGDYQTAFKNYNLIISKNGDYSLSYSVYGFANYNENGKWFFNGDKTKVIFDPSSNNNSNDEWTILRLKDKELWARDDDFGGKILEVHLIPK